MKTIIWLSVSLIVISSCEPNEVVQPCLPNIDKGSYNLEGTITTNGNQIHFTSCTHVTIKDSVVSTYFMKDSCNSNWMGFACQQMFINDTTSFNSLNQSPYLHISDLNGDAIYPGFSTGLHKNSFAVFNQLDSNTFHLEVDAVLHPETGEKNGYHNRQFVDSLILKVDLQLTKK